MHIVRESDIPIMSDNANCMNSLLSALKYIYMQAATTYKNHNTYGFIKYSQKGIIIKRNIDDMKPGIITVNYFFKS